MCVCGVCDVREFNVCACWVLVSTEFLSSGFQKTPRTHPAIFIDAVHGDFGNESDVRGHLWVVVSAAQHQVVYPSVVVCL